MKIKLNQDYLVTGVWIINGKDVFYNQYSTVTFLCPMRFERYPLDEHICRSENQKIDSVMKNIDFPDDHCPIINIHSAKDLAFNRIFVNHQDW